MASEYLKWKYRDVKPDEPPRELTKKEKAANWFYYYKWWLLAGAVLIAILGSILWNALGIGKVRPDYIFAYVGEYALPEDCAAALQEQLAALGEDVNGDGQTAVELRQYVSGNAENAPESAMQYAYAATVTLSADINQGESYFFLMQDPEGFQLTTQALAGPDGSMPERDDYSVDGRAYLWSDCPALAGLPLGGYEQEALDGTAYSGDCQELLADLYIGRRGFYNEKQAKNLEQNEALWEILIEGATVS